MVTIMLFRIFIFLYSRLTKSLNLVIIISNTIIYYYLYALYWIVTLHRVEYQFPDFSQYRAIITHNGRVRWEPAGVFETSCKFDITFYPYDTQECNITFGTWTYTIYQLNLTNSSELVILDDYKKSGEWNIISAGVTREEFFYSGNPQMRFSKVLYLNSVHESGWDNQLCR